MNKKSLFTHLFSILATFYSFAQTGSGTIEFVTSGGETFSIDAVASDLFLGGNSYNITGNTNSPINFGAWQLELALGLEEDLQLEHFQVMGNPSSELNVLLKVDDPTLLFVKIFDINGREMGSPQIEFQQNGFMHIYDPFANVNNGLYFVQIKNKNQYGSFKFLKNDNISGSKAQVTNRASKNTPKNQVSSKTSGSPNYNISWSNINGLHNGSVDVDVLESATNVIQVNAGVNSSTENGDIAFTIRLNGNPKDNYTITLTNTHIPDTTYAMIQPDIQSIFWDVFVSNANNPSTYQVTIEDNRADGIFLTTTTTIDIYQDVDGVINGSNIIDVTPIPNEVDVTVVARNFDDLSLFENNTLVKLYDASDNTLIDELITDSSGIATFNNVTGGASVYTKISKTNYYAKTNNEITLSSPNVISEMTDTLNVISVPYKYYADGSPITSDTLNLYRPQYGHNTELILGHLRVYVSNEFYGNEQLVIDRLKFIAEFMGFKDAFIFVDEPFDDYIMSGISGSYYPFIENRNILEGQVGFNIVSGSETGAYGPLINDNHVIIHGECRLGLRSDNGEWDYSLIDHEVGHMLGFPHMVPLVSFPSAMSYVGIQFDESKYDEALMPFWYKLIEMYYNKLDSDSRLVEYSFIKINGFED